MGGGAALLIAPQEAPAAAAPPAPTQRLDLLGYGRPADIGFDPDEADRRFDFSVGRRPGFIDGRPGFWWSINGHLFPDVPMFVVAEGDVVRMTISNGSGDVHPMHLHGHHAVVLSRDGVAATGSPWWVDSLNVEDGETYEIAFVADNPGIWMDHCHNLDHAADGLVAHLAYTGRQRAVPRREGRRRRRRQRARVGPQAARRGAPGRRRELWWRGFERPTGRGADRGSGTIGVPDVASTRTAS